MKPQGDMRKRRRWYSPGQIDTVTEAALRSAALWPSGDPPVVDIERFVEVHLAAIVDYGVDLDDRILGYTIFGQPPRVVVNRRLTDLATSATATLGLRGRWRATLAHEAMHLLIHRADFSAGNQSAPQLESQAAGGAQGSWREVQANMGMAALLVPRQPLVREVEARIGEAIIFPPLPPESAWAVELATWISSRFEVSRQLARIRLSELGFLGAVR